MYNSIIIPLDYTLDLTSNSASDICQVSDTFGMTNGASVSVTGGTMINSALQCILAMKIRTETRDEHMLHSNII